MSTRILRSVRLQGPQGGVVSRQRGRLQLKGVASVRMRSRGPRRSLQDPTRGRRHRQPVLPQTRSPPSPGSRVNLEADDSGWTGMEADGGQGTDAEARPGSDPVGWNEPALPMALPPGMAPSDLGERREPGHEEELDGELLPKPDPTWPRLFGSRAEAQAIAETDDVSSPPGQPAVPGRGTTGEQPVEASREHASRERQGGLPESQHGSRSTDHRQVVDVTGEEPRIGGESTPQPGTGQQPTAIVASSAAAGADDCRRLEHIHRHATGRGRTSGLAGYPDESP